MAQVVRCGSCGQPVDVPQQVTPDGPPVCPWCGELMSIDARVAGPAEPLSGDSAQGEGVSAVAVQATGSAPSGRDLGTSFLVVSETGAGGGQTAVPTLGEACTLVAAPCPDTPGIPVEPGQEMPQALPGEVQVGVVEALAGPIPPQPDAVLCQPVPQTEWSTPRAESSVTSAAVADLQGAEQTASSPAQGAVAVSDLPIADEGMAAVAEEPPADSSPGADATSLAHALGDLWRQAGVAPPWSTPREEASMPERQAVESVSSSVGQGVLGEGLHEFSAGPQRAVGSFAARAQAQEKVGPRKLVRAVGMVVSGLLAIGLTYGVFKLFGWGERLRPPRPEATQKAEIGQPKAPPSAGKEHFVPDWKGLKTLGDK